MISLLSFLVAATSLFLTVQVTRKFWDKQLSGVEAFSWGTLFLAIGTVFVIPTIATSLANFFGVGRGVDFAVYIAIIALFYITYRIYVKVDKVEEEITELVREIAIQRTDE